MTCSGEPSATSVTKSQAPPVASILSTAALASELTVKVVDPQSASVPGAQVELFAKNSTRPAAVQTTSAQGEAHFSSVPSGELRVHVLAPGFAEQWIEIHGPRITRIHVKDVLKHRGRCGNQSVYTNIFLGDNNWPAIRQAMRKVKYDGWLIAEMESRYRYAADQQVFDTAAGLNRLIAGNF